MLDPQARALLDLMEARGIPPTHTLTVEDARRFYRERRHATQPAPVEVGEVRELRTGGDAGVPLRLYRPTQPLSGAAPSPVLVYFHGGGWTIGDLDTHDSLCRALCERSGVAVVAVDYRLGPEHRLPAAPDDAIEALRWVRREAASLGLDAARIAVGGDSAGGNLAAVACLQSRDEGDPLPLWQLLIYPSTDMRMGTASHEENGEGYLLTRETMAWFRGHYFGEAPHCKQDWRASPALAPDHRGLPPALVLTAGFDPLRDEGRGYADLLSQAGNAVQLVEFPRQIHGFITMGRVIDEAETAVSLCAAALRAVMAASMPR